MQATIAIVELDGLQTYTDTPRLTWTRDCMMTPVGDGLPTPPHTSCMNAAGCGIIRSTLSAATSRRAADAP